MTGLTLVTGATGVVGRELVPQLVTAGQRVRVLVRDRAKADFGPAVEVVHADLERPGTLSAAFADVEKVVTSVNGPDIALLEANAFEAARRAEVRQIVKVSALEAFQSHMDGTAHARAHVIGEERLRQLGVTWTMVRPGFFTSNLHLYFMRPTASGAALYLPTGEGEELPIDPRDIAAVVVRVLTSEGHEGKVYSLSGPQRLSYAEMAQKITAATGVPVEHVDVTKDDARTRFLADGFPPEFVDFVLAHFAGVKAGKMTLAAGISDLLGRPAATFDDWLTRNSLSIKQFLRSKR
jgi:uncharacterized protein YbjT (DUF2867 family)